MRDISQQVSVTYLDSIYIQLSIYLYITTKIMYLNLMYIHSDQCIIMIMCQERLTYLGHIIINILE